MFHDHSPEEERRADWSSIWNRGWRAGCEEGQLLAMGQFFAFQNDNSLRRRRWLNSRHEAGSLRDLTLFREDERDCRVKAPRIGGGNDKRFGLRLTGDTRPASTDIMLAHLPPMVGAPFCLAFHKSDQRSELVQHDRIDDFERVGAPEDMLRRVPPKRRKT